MLYLKTILENKVIRKYDKDFDKFINEEWGGYYPYYKDGKLHYWNFLGCENNAFY